MRLAQYNHMVSAFAPHGADQTLRVGVLPGRPRRSWSITDPQRAQTSPYDVAIDGISISHQISWRCVPWERFGHLSSNPLGRRMRRHGVVNELSPAVRKKHQTVEQFEADRGDDEQIRRGNPRCM